MIETNGEPISGAVELGKATRRACKRAGVSPATCHQLRHTFASHLAARVSLPIVGTALGRADPKTTARYAHLDTTALARDPRLHLDFAAADATVLARTSEPDRSATRRWGSAKAGDRADH